MHLDDIAPLGSFLKEGLIIFDQAGTIVSVNVAMCEILSCDKNTLLQTSVKNFVNERVLGGAQKNPDLADSIDHLFEQPNTAASQYRDVALTHTTSVGTICVGRYPDGTGDLGIIVFRDESIERELDTYKRTTHETFSKLMPVLKKTASGDFSSNIDITDTTGGEFSELLIGVQLMIDDLVDLSVRKDVEQKKQVQEIKESETDFAQKAQQASLELQKAKQHIEIIIESLTSGLIEYNGEFRLKRINHSAERLLGVKREDVVETKILPEHKDQKEKASLAIVSYPVLAKEGKRIDGKKFGFYDNVTVHEITVDYPERRELEVVTLALIGSDVQQHEGFIKVIRDITKEKEISRSKSDFINIAAHQLRTPLSAIKWVIRMILDGDVGALNPNQRKLLDKGYETNEKMINMVNDLLNVARIEDDRFGYVFKEGDIVTTITSVVDELRIIAEKGGVDLIFDKPAHIDPFVFDQSKIQLAMHNLIGNGIKYTREGGTVRVSLTREEKEVVVTVQDTGVGIPAGQIDKMFTKFFRAENAVRLQVGGSGLGLFIVKDIVARHGGNITVKSVEGQGTTFVMRIQMTHESNH